MPRSNIEILAYEETPLGILCLRRRELLSQPGTVVTEITLNHEFLMSSLYTESEQILSRTSLEMHRGTDLSVLVGGLGLGYTVREAIQSKRVEHVESVELLPQVIDWMEQGLVPLSSELCSERRLSITQGDVFHRLSGAPTERYDIILIDIDHSPNERLDESSSSFYTKTGLIAAQQHLASKGVLGVWSYDENPTFAESLREVFEYVRVERVSFHNHLVDERITDWLFFGVNA